MTAEQGQILRLVFAGATPSACEGPGELAPQGEGGFVLTPGPAVSQIDLTCLPGEGEAALTLTVPEGAGLTLIERGAARTALHLAAGANLSHARLGGAGVCVVRLDDGAHYQQGLLITNDAACVSEVELLGAKARASLAGAMLLSGDAKGSILVRMLHKAPAGVSRQLFKVVLDDRAKGAFEGRVIVARGAAGSDAHQLCRTLLLSDQALMNAKPELEIDEDDVVCGHGSAMGALDDDALFYLRARGIGEEDSRRLLVRAFAQEAWDGLEDKALGALLEAEAERWFA